MHMEVTRPPGTRRIAVAAGAMAMVLGGGHVVAWVSGVMTEIPASTIVMKTNAGFGLLACGLALILSASPHRQPLPRRAASACAVFVFLLGGMTLSEHLFGWNLGIDEMLATEQVGAAATASPNRMGPPASLSFVLLGTALLMLNGDGASQRRALHEWFAATVALLALLSIIGYLYGVSSLYSIARFTGIAWPTALSLLMLAVGVLCARPEHGLMAWVTADDPGGALLRVVLGPVIVLPLVFGWVRLVSERRGWVDAAMGTSLMMLIFIVTFSSLLLFTGRRISSSSAALTERDREVRSQKDLLAVTLASIGDAVIVTDTAHAVTFLNLEAERLTGWADRDARGRPVSQVFTIVDEQSDEALQSTVHRVLDPGLPVGLGVESVLRARDGRRILIEASGALIRTAGGQVKGVVLVFREITHRKRAEEALRESERKYRIVANHTHAWEFWLDADGRVLYNSPSCERITGYDAQAFEADAMLLEGIIHPEDQHAYAAHRGVRHELCATEEAEFRIVRGDGGIRWISHVCMPVHEDGRFLGIRGSNRDITERKTAEHALTAARESAERAKAEAERANRAKDDFLAMLSHELRTPLTPVLTAIAMLQEDPRCDDAGIQQTVGVLRRNVEIEARLIDDLLDVTRIVRGRIELEKKPVRLCEVIQRAVEVCGPDIEARRLHFGVDMGACAQHMVNADVARLQQVFWNLLKNAVRFTPHGGCVGIRCRVEGQTLVTEVNDSGVGVDPADLPRLFNAFEQVNRSTEKPLGGLGLGLTIARAIVELHDGRIDAYSEGRHKGTTFRVVLPVAASSELTHIGRDESPAAPDSPSRRLRILLVEDHGDTAHMTRLMLTMAGHDVRVVGDVATALDDASRESYDLVLSDLGLPDGSGVDLLRQLRQRGHAMPAIAVSGYGREEDVQRSRDAGFVQHLVKPVSPERLLEAIASAAKGCELG